MASITVTGNATADPELKFLNNGTAVANFTIAENHRKKNPDTGSYEDDGTTFYRVAAWRQLGENTAESIVKGNQVTVTGTFRTREYTAKDGSTGRSLDITADTVGPNLQFATAKAAKTSGGIAASAPSAGGGDPWAPQSDDNPPF